MNLTKLKQYYYGFIGNSIFASFRFIFRLFRNYVGIVVEATRAQCDTMCRSTTHSLSTAHSKYGVTHGWRFPLIALGELNALSYTIHAHNTVQADLFGTYTGLGVESRN